MSTARQTALVTEGDLGIRPVRARPTYELVVGQIHRALALGRFSAGDMLPPERELAQQLGVSRTVVREAIRVLEGEGLIQVTRGATGGSRVLPAGGTRRLSREELRRQTDEIDQVSEFRLATECAAARGAALRRTKADVATLRDLARRGEEMLEAAAGTEDETERARLSTRFIALDHRLHLAIAAASRNHYLAEAVETARLSMHRPVGTICVVTIGDLSPHHGEIVDAIAAKDADAAVQAMAAHIEDTRVSAIEQLTRRAAKG
jgi:GntR family transcriptional regulator, transcriptional repressor for pyruvate dehydrogenase complex